jgi:hypothetical protein
MDFEKIRNLHDQCVLISFLTAVWLLAKMINKIIFCPRPGASHDTLTASQIVTAASGSLRDQDSANYDPPIGGCHGKI